MNRRGVLKGLGVATAATLWPGWLREAFAGPPCGVMRGSATLAAAIKRANDGVKPLLVLVIPRSSEEKNTRGEHFGEWLNHGSDGALAALACAELICAEMGAVRQLFPSAPATGEPAMLIADVDRSPASLRVAMAAFHSHEGDSEERWDPPGKEDESIQQCIARTSATAYQALLGNAGAVQARAAALRQQLDGTQLQLAQGILEGAVTGTPPPPTVMRLAPLLAAAMVGGGAAAERRLTPVLAAAARAVYCRQRIPGSKWATSDGCGETIEGEVDAEMVDCGMGYVPPKSRRFLYFFTKSPDQLFFNDEQ
jgi:hypothetical protein